MKIQENKGTSFILKKFTYIVFQGGGSLLSWTRI